MTAALIKMLSLWGNAMPKPAENMPNRSIRHLKRIRRRLPRRYTP
jgi:hypothetical protein